jgi:hypothetical protein
MGVICGFEDVRKRFPDCPGIVAERGPIMKVEVADGGTTVRG